MLADRDSQLLTAYLDGELGTRQRKAVTRLLHRSADARKLFEQLQQDANALRDLPPHKLPANFPLRVLRTIAERGVRPGGSPPVPRPAAIPAWVGLGLAAAVLLAVTAGSFLYFSPSPGQ